MLLTHRKATKARALRKQAPECINKIKEWFSTNYLQLNEDKKN